MNIETIIPYIKRMKRQKTDLKVTVFSQKKTTMNKIKEFNLFQTLVDDECHDSDCVVFDYNKVDLSKYDFWEKMSVNGWVVLSDTPENFDAVRKWRKEHKITSLLVRISGLIYFQKEDYADRKANKTPPPELDRLMENINQFSPEDNAIEEIKWWESHMKQEYVWKYSPNDAKIFVETGTYIGQTVEAIRRMKKFEKIISIEIDDRLFKRAEDYFAIDSTVEIVHGDSVDKMIEICNNLYLKDFPAVFWLDAHASGPLKGGEKGPNPLIEELTAIRETGRKDHTIFIDDKRLFGSAEWGNLQLQEVMDQLKLINPDYQIIYLDGEIPNDIICATTVVNENIVPNDSQEGSKILMDEINKFFRVEKKETRTAEEKPAFVFLD